MGPVDAASGGNTLSAVVFDLAGVITDDPFRVMGAVASELDIESADFAAIAVGRGDYGSGEHPWHRLERGEIEIDEYNRLADEMARSRGLAGFPPLPVDLILEGLLNVRPEMLELLGELRAAGISTAIVTYNVRALGGWRDVADWDELVDAVVDSCEVGMRKPEAQIYRYACSALHVEPSAAVFLDDMQPNVDGAAAVGLSAILVTDPAAAIAAVRELTNL